MKRYRLLPLFLLAAALLPLSSCGRRETDFPEGDCVRAAITYYESHDAYSADSGEQAVIDSRTEIDALLDIASGLVQDEAAFHSSRPMDFPRYELCFEVEGGGEYTLAIDSGGVFSGSMTGELGNWYFSDGNDGGSWYEAVGERFSEADAKAD